MSDNGIERETENKAAGVGREDNYEDDEVNAPGAGEDDGIERGNANDDVVAAEDERRGGRGDNYKDDEDNASGAGEDDGIERGNADADVDAEDIGRGEHENEAANLDDDSSFEEFMEAYHNPEVRERRERRLQRIADQELEQRRAEREEQRRVEREELRAQMERLEEQENRRRALDLDHWDEDVLNRVVNEFETIRPRLAGRAVLLIHQLEPSPLLFDPDVVVERTLHTIAFTDAVDYGLLSNHLSWENGFPLINFYRTGWMTEVYNIPDDDDFARDMLDAVQPETDLDIYAFNVFLDKMDVARNGLWRDE